MGSVLIKSIPVIGSVPVGVDFTDGTTEPVGGVSENIGIDATGETG
jgi:hypothetical protein